MEMSLVLRLPRDMHLAHPLQTMPANAFEMLQNLHVLLTFDRCTIPCACHEKRHLVRTCGNVLRATAVCTFSTSQLPKVHRRWCGLYVFTAKCASRHNGLHFFHLKFQTCSVFLASSLQNLLRATTACNFSSPISPDGSAPGTLASLLFDPKKTRRRLARERKTHFSSSSEYGSRKK